MPRPAKVKTETDAAPASKKIPRLIYTPFEDHPVTTVWNRHRFEANVPTEIRDVKGGHSAETMLELARNNPQFRIEGEDKAKASAVTEPTTPEQYRNYAANWIRSAKTSTGLVSRWDAETEMRADCGVGTDDIEYLTTLFNPKKSALAKAEAAMKALADN